MIYKYSPPNRFTLENLAAQSVYCRHHQEFNDPFEFWVTVNEGLPGFDDDDERFTAAVAAWGFPGTKLKDLPLDRETFMEYFGSLGEGAPEMSIIHDRARVACFSSDPTNLLMWSHYADGLRGCCLGYDSQTIITESETEFIADVQYLESPPAIDTLVYAVTEDLFFFAVDHGYKEYEGEAYRKKLNTMMSSALASKPREWQYERERRLIIHTRQDDKAPIHHRHPARALKTVIVGERLDDEYRAALKAVIQALGTPISTQIATRSFNSYAITLQDVVL